MTKIKIGDIARERKGSRREYKIINIKDDYYVSLEATNPETPDMFKTTGITKALFSYDFEIIESGE